MTADADDQPMNYTEAMVRLKSRVSTMEDRPQQDVAARAIEKSIQDGSILVCQAGTGVGKSNAALIPAITSGARVVYATATKVLQSQIFDKDLPFLRENLGIDFSFASLKGWASYVCHAKLAEFDGPARQVILDEFEANPDHIGDRDSISIELSDKEWMDLSLSSDECPGRGSCPFGPVCRPQAARDRVLTADVAVVNHSVLATDAIVQSMTDGGFSLVGPADVLIVDEAHELEEFISGVLGEQFTLGSVRHLDAQVRSLLRKARITTEQESAAVERVGALMDAAVTFFDGLPEGRLYHKLIVEDHAEIFTNLIIGYSGVWQLLTSDEMRESVNSISDMTEKNRARASRERLVKTCKNKMDALTQMLTASDADVVRYVEATKKVFRGREEISKMLKLTPVSVAPWASEFLWPLYQSVVLISATILVDGSADFISGRLGISNFTSMDAGTPFDYQRQAVLYVPELPDPAKERSRWENITPQVMLELVKVSGGGALLLFTSNKQLRSTWEAIAHRIPFPCKRQGDESNNRLMAWFREEHDGVLFATRSFFTGASFEGDTCRLVVIDKLPFPVPTEPVFQARSEAIESRGGDSFSELTIPMMTLPLQQGFGRLIRTKKDRGVVAILDPRITSKGYGRKIIRSLPPAKLSTSQHEVEAFFS